MLRGTGLGSGKKQGLNPTVWLHREISRHHSERDRSQERLPGGDVQTARSVSATGAV